MVLNVSKSTSFSKKDCLSSPCFFDFAVHCAGGHLVHQFLDSTSNKRTDAYGGSIENRARFGLEILRELVSIWDSKRVAIRLGPTGGYNDMG